MNRDELVARIALVLSERMGEGSLSASHHYMTLAADSADLILEEAAKIADEHISLLNGQYEVLDVSHDVGALKAVATSIRALKGESQ